MFGAILLALFATVANAALAGSINQPLNGAAIAPGSLFNFTYNPLADYSVSTFAYHVWLLAASQSGSPANESVDVNHTLASLSASGHYYGRYDYPNYPAVPYPTNPCPAQLTMPDFSKSASTGFSAGKSAHDLPMQLLVIEEWGNGEPTVGRRLHTTSVGIIYNATKHHT